MRPLPYATALVAGVGLLGAALSVSGCIHASGDVKIYNLEEPRTRYGVFFRVPQPSEGWRPPRYTDFTRWGHWWSPYDVEAAYSRRDRHYPAGFDIHFAKRDTNVMSDEWKDEILPSLKFPLGSAWKEENVSFFRTASVRKWGRECMAFEIERRWLNVGNLGEINREFGMCLIHPEDEEVIVVFSFGDRFVPREGEKADTRVDALAEELYRSVQFVPPVEKERKLLRAGKEWISAGVW